MIKYDVVGEEYKLVDTRKSWSLGNGVSVTIFCFGPHVPVLAQAQVSILFDCREEDLSKVIDEYHFRTNGYLGVYEIEKDAEDCYYGSMLDYDPGTGNEEKGEPGRITFFDENAVLALGMYFRVSYKKLDTVLGYFHGLDDVVHEYYDEANLEDEI